MIGMNDADIKVDSHDCSYAGDVIFMSKNFVLAISIVFVCSASAVGQKFEGLALTPPMGWNSWNTFACNVDEALIRETADAIVASGMRDAGYQYVVIDDCWHGKRDSLGFIHPDPNRFPSGMKVLADYLHAQGLKFGIYSCAGDQTCGGYPGSRGHEYQDALTYAQWGVDYLKYDWCNTEGLSAVGAYTTMSRALRAAGRPMVFSLCEWGDTKPWEWAKNIGHLWRTTGDITDCFDCEVSHGNWSSWGILRTIEMRKGIRPAAGPDHWNDPDMMEVGKGMSQNEDRAHFSLWAIVAAPLIAGNDVRKMKSETIELLMNKEVIAVDQDSMGVQGLKFKDNEQGVEIWAKPLMRGDWAICFLNRSEQKHKIEIDWSRIVIGDDISKMRFNANETTFTVRDLWKKKNIGDTRKNLVTEIASHDVFMIRLMKQ
jgi:alpha-galactosidase